MSRSGEQYLFEIAAAGKYFSAWVCDDRNLPVLVEAINRACAEYDRQRTDRVNMCGVPTLEDPSAPLVAPTARREEEVLASPPPPARAVSQDEQDTAVSVSVVTEKVSHALYSAASTAYSAASTALYWARLFSAKAMDAGLSNSSEKFRKMFPRVDRSNARLAFLYIGQLSNGWAVEYHQGIGRASLSTLILTAVLDEFVDDKGVHSELSAGKELDGDDKEYVDIAWVKVGKGSEADKVDPDLPPLSNFLYSYKKEISPLKYPEQAKQIFLAFAGTDATKGLLTPLKEHIAKQAQQLEEQKRSSAAAAPK